MDKDSSLRRLARRGGRLDREPPQRQYTLATVAAWAGIVGAAAAVISVLITLYGPDLFPGAPQGPLDSLSDTARNTEEIAAGLRELPNAVPNDPQVALVARGYNMKPSEFYRAIRNSDVQSIELFCRAAPEGWFGPQLMMNAPLDLEPRLLLTACPTMRNGTGCNIAEWSKVSSQLRAYFRAADDRKDFITTICGGSFTADLLATAIDNDRAECQSFFDRAVSFNRHARQENWSRTYYRAMWYKSFPGTTGSPSCVRKYGIDVGEIYLEY